MPVIEQQLASFEGYAKLEIMGHQSATGYVTTQYFGGTAVFRVVQQEHPPEEITLDADQWLDGERLYAGSKVRVSRPRAEAFVGAASLYRMTVCTEAEADAMQSKKIEVIERAERKALTTHTSLSDAAVGLATDTDFENVHDDEEVPY